MTCHGDENERLRAVIAGAAADLEADYGHELDTHLVRRVIARLDRALLDGGGASDTSSRATTASPSGSSIASPPPSIPETDDERRRRIAGGPPCPICYARHNMDRCPEYPDGGVYEPEAGAAT